MSVASLTAGGTGALSGFGTGGTYSLLLEQFTTLFFVTVIRTGCLKYPAEHSEESAAIFPRLSLLAAVQRWDCPIWILFRCDTAHQLLCQASWEGGDDAVTVRDSAVTAPSKP